jgi:hypothetical protein
MLLNITAVSACKADCIYCPQAAFQAAMAGRPAYLSRQEFAELLPNLADTQFEGFSFGGFSEPFENPDIVELLRLAAAQSFAGPVSVYSNGEALTPDMVEALRDVPLARVDISCHGFDDDIYRRTRRFLDPRKVRDNVLFLLRNRENIGELVISVTGPFGSAAAKNELAELCRRFGARLEHRALHSRAGLLRIGRVAMPATPGAFRCAKFDFAKPVLVPGGDLSLCCQDFGLVDVIGNLHRQSFEDIMAHSPRRRHILDVAAGREQDPGLRCYQCQFCVPAPQAQVA